VFPEILLEIAMQRIALFAIMTLCCVPNLWAESAMEVAERFAVTEDREAVVASLVPGTEEHFYYRCLLWQHQNKLAEVDALVPRWEALHPDASSQRERIILRQAVLWFDVDPVIGSQRLAEMGDVQFSLNKDPDRPQIGDDASLPSVLPPALLTPQALIKAAESNGTPDGWSNEGLALRLADIHNPDQRRAALKKLPYPTFPKALDSIIADLAEPGGDFGSIDLHRFMTIAQLDACRVAVPALAEDHDFNLTYLRALRQRQQGVDVVNDRAARRAWIQQLPFQEIAKLARKGRP
jgi:hypothetical protein